MDEIKRHLEAARRWRRLAEQATTAEIRAALIGRAEECDSAAWRLDVVASQAEAAFLSQTSAQATGSGDD